jgi:hypothetical protein
VIGAFVFLLSRSLKNRVAVRMKRLRQPKYLISALGGIVYLYLTFIHPSIRHGGGRAPAPFPMDAGVAALAETGLSLVLLCLVLVPWVLPSGPGALFFSRSEIQFLFPAPVSRRTLLRFRIAKSQLAILFGVLVTAVIFARIPFATRPAYFVATLWIAYTFLALYRMGTSLARAGLAERGVPPMKHQVAALVVILALVVSAAVWLKWFLPVKPQIGSITPSELLSWGAEVTGSGPAYYVLLPFRVLIRPATAPDILTFLLRLLPAAGILTALYLWILHTDASFEEASLDRAEKTARSKETGGARISARPRPGRPRRVPFELAPHGAPHVAFFWKNLIATSRFSSFRTVAILFAVGVAVAAGSGGDGGQAEVVRSIVGGLSAGIAVFITLIGPVILRDDLRVDLLHMDLIKTYPVPAWSLVLGEILAPAAIIASIQWTVIGIGAAVLPAIGSQFWTIGQRVAFGLAAAILFPCFSLAALVLQNGAALIMPGWMQLGRHQQRGIEAMGQRLITIAITTLVLVLAVIPSAMIFGAVYLVGHWLIGLAIVPVAAAAAAGGLVVETGLGVLWLGRLFEKLDVSVELYDTSQAD